MEHLICINTNSFPAEDIQSAKNKFTDAIEGVLELNKGEDRFTFFLDSPDNKKLADFELAKGYTYQDYADDIANDDVDLYTFLLEIDDKSPALESVSDDVFAEMASYSFYVKGNAVDEFCDVYSFAWFMSATLLSLNSDVRWSRDTVSICRTSDGAYISEDLLLNNIASFEHGSAIYTRYNALNINELCSGHYVDEKFTTWFNSLDENNIRRVSDKLQLACNRNFQGGEPLFKTLNNASGLREIRFNAYPGGAVRILFKHRKNNEQVILIGFIKKSDSDGYDAAIRFAEERFEELIKNS